MSKQVNGKKAGRIASLALSLAWMASTLWAQVPPSGTNDAQAAAAAAKTQLQQDEAAYKADLQAARAACKTPGAGCDAAKAKLKADRAVLKADKESFRKAWRAAGGRRKDKAK